MGVDGGGPTSGRKSRHAALFFLPLKSLSYNLVDRLLCMATQNAPRIHCQVLPRPEKPPVRAGYIYGAWAWVAPIFGPACFGMPVLWGRKTKE